MLQIQDPLVKLNKKKIFSEVKGEIFIGGEKIKPELREILKEQARYISTSQLFEILNDTLNAESADMALNKSTEWNHVLGAKMLKYWIDVLNTMILKLKQ